MFHTIEGVLVCFFLISLVIYFFNRSKEPLLSSKQIIGILAVKLIFGCIYGYLFLKVYHGDDTWLYHQESLEEYAWLKRNPWTFIVDLFTNGYHTNQSLSFFNSSNSFWKDLQYNILIKLLAIFNLFSFGDYYVNTLFFNLITFWGHLYLFKLCLRYFPTKRNILLALIFFFPPLLFWQSGIRKDGLVFVALTGCIYYFVLYVEEKKISSILKVLCFLVLLFLIRNFVALSIFPPFIAYAFIKKIQTKQIMLTNLLSLILCIVLFFATNFGPEPLRLPKKMAERQDSFLDLKGNSFMPIDHLNQNFSSYAKTFFTSLNHTFVRPYISEGKSPLLLFAAVETSFVWMLLIVALLNWRSLALLIKNPIINLLFFTALINYILIGYTVPFAGAIVRYRVIFEVFILIPLVMAFDINNPLVKRVSKIIGLKASRGNNN